MGRELNLYIVTAAVYGGMCMGVLMPIPKPTGYAGDDPYKMSSEQCVIGNGFRVCKHVVWCFLLRMTVADAITILKSFVPMPMSFNNLSSLSLFYKKEEPSIHISRCSV
ncbi:hypothetical protein AHAS_Ahas14G0102300 [Arachis hypogaea]